jgi:hypothetical protein
VLQKLCAHAGPAAGCQANARKTGIEYGEVIQLLIFVCFALIFFHSFYCSNPMQQSLRWLRCLPFAFLLSALALTCQGQALVKVNTLRLTGAAVDMEARGSVLHLANFGNNTLEALDLTNPATPVSRGTTSVSGRVRGLAFGGDYAYVTNFGIGSATSGTIVSFGFVPDPFHPGSAYTASTGAPTTTIASSSAVVAVTSVGLGVEKRVYDPYLRLKSIIPPTNGPAGGVGFVLNGNVLYDGGRVIGLSDLANPVFYPNTTAAISVVDAGFGYGGTPRIGGSTNERQ